MKLLLILTLCFLVTKTFAQLRNTSLSPQLSSAPAEVRVYFRSIVNKAGSFGAQARQGSLNNYQDSRMNQSLRPFNPDFPFPGSKMNGETVNVFSTHTLLRKNIHVTCDYLYDNQGRLADAMPSIRFGK